MKACVLISIVFLLTACSLRVSAGGAYVLKEPEDRITGHEQFRIGVEGVARVTEKINVISGWNHYSNGAQLGIGNYPNYGLDFFYAGAEYTFDLID